MQTQCIKKEKMIEVKKEINQSLITG